MKILLISILSFSGLAFGALSFNINSRVNIDGGSDTDILWDAYCNRDGQIPSDSIDIPKVNYENPLVRAAAEKLDQVAPSSFYLYGHVMRMYGFKKESILRKGLSKQDARNFNYQYVSLANPKPDFIKWGNTHAFLTYLCGEFRDRPSMIEAKLKWTKNINKLAIGDQSEIKLNKKADDGSEESVWSQLVAKSYPKYVQFTRQLFYDKKQRLSIPNIQLGDYLVDGPIPAFTICETEFILKEYIASNKEYDGWDRYRNSYAIYKDKNCLQDGMQIAEKLDYYYDFRGDSNYKPYSPESNGMIWHAMSILKGCRRDSSGKLFFTKGYSQSNKIQLSDCENYLRNPFNSRYSAARAALATWLARDFRFDGSFAADESALTTIPHFHPEALPFSFQIGEQEYPDYILDYMLESWSNHFDRDWMTSSFGMLQTFGYQQGKGYSNAGLTYERLRDAVNRHTNWYHSGYNDSLGKLSSQAYSPFVASSYEMSASDDFTSCGYTVKCPNDYRKRWMFIFKIHKSKWFTSQSIKNGVAINFEKHWLDETSLGTNRLAKKERAFDKLGTAFEEELDSILYLHNIKTNGSIVPDYSPETGWDFN